MITISNVKIYPFDPGLPFKDLKAYAEIKFEDSLIIKGIKIFEKDNGGIFIKFPSIPGKGGQYKEVVVAENIDLKKMIRNKVVEAYKNEKLKNN